MRLRFSLLLLLILTFCFQLVSATGEFYQESANVSTECGGTFTTSRSTNVTNQTAIPTLSAIPDFGNNFLLHLGWYIYHPNPLFGLVIFICLIFMLYLSRTVIIDTLKIIFGVKDEEEEKKSNRRW